MPQQHTHTHAHTHTCTCEPRSYLSGSMHTLHPQRSHLEFTRSTVPRILFHHSNTSMSAASHTHTHTHTHTHAHTHTHTHMLTHSYFIFTTFPFSLSSLLFFFILQFLAGFYGLPLSSPPLPPRPPPLLFLSSLPCLLCSFRNFGPHSKLLNQLQAAAAPWAPFAGRLSPHMLTPGSVCVRGEGADRQTCPGEGLC